MSRNLLPQGSPCSPVISNLVAHLLDMRLVKLASAAGCTYSRYADDLTFSTNKKKCPVDIAVPSGSAGAPSHLWLPGEPLQKVIKRSGFRINAKKTHLMYRTSRQNVTGLVVNEKINVRWEYRHNARAMVHSLVKTGAFTILGVTQRDGQAVLENRPGRLDELHGMLGFIDSIDADNEITASDCRSDKRSSKEEVYRKFLIYSIFYAAQAPVVLCEGKTDTVYLTHAIRSLAGDFPDLAEVMPDKKIRLKVRLYKYPQSSTARLLCLNDGGSGLLAKFIHDYDKETRQFGPRQTNPVVILYDNDAGAESIRRKIKDISKVRPTGEEPFVHVTKNMYAVPTPDKHSKIEDLFDPTIKATVLNGKTFNDGKNFEVDKHYGKVIFAHKVVRPRRND